MHIYQGVGMDANCKKESDTTPLQLFDGSHHRAPVGDFTNRLPIHRHPRLRFRL